MKVVCCSTALKILFVFDSKIQNIGHFSLICLYLIESETILPINQSPKILLVMV